LRACKGCGDCCGHYLPLADNEIAEIWRYTKEHGIEPRWTGRSCPWLTEDSTCAIYDVRPSVCRAYHCVKGLAGTIPGDGSGHHIYNTERLFIYLDVTTYDALADLGKSLGHGIYKDLFEDSKEART
jgi:Fe-S-cluster containining protein